MVHHMPKHQTNFCMLLIFVSIDPYNNFIMLYYCKPGSWQPLARCFDDVNELTHHFRYLLFDFFWACESTNCISQEVFDYSDDYTFFCVLEACHQSFEYFNLRTFPHGHDFFQLFINVINKAVDVGRANDDRFDHRFDGRHVSKRVLTGMSLYN